MITVIYTIRDRDPARVEQSIQSLRKNSSIDFQVIVVDYGSHCKERIKTICENLSVSRIRCESEGLPWSKSHAINIGVRNASTQYIVVTDIDMIFESDILRLSLEKIAPKCSIHCRPYWLPKNGKKESAWLGDFSQLGGYQFIHKQAFYDLKGMEEKIKYWGKEDHEWAIRLKMNGYEQIWLDKNVKMYHKWHEIQTGIFDKRPQSVVSDTWEFMISNVINDERENVNWGENLAVKDRPIINLMNEKKAKEIIIDDYIFQLPELLKSFKKNQFVCLSFGNRFVNNTSSQWTRSVMNFVNRRISRKLGFTIKKKANTQFDQWYVSLPYLRRVGLIDYFISKNHEKVYLLFLPC